MEDTGIDFLLEQKNDNVTVVVDPPRQGLSPRVIETLIRIEPKQIIYVLSKIFGLASLHKKPCSSMVH